MLRFFLAVILMTASLSWSMPITARSWVVAKEDGTKVASMNDSKVMPIASITKLMTVMVVLDAKWIGLEEGHSKERLSYLDGDGVNERILELAEQAMGTRKHVPPVWQFYDTELEKFAELIVRECAKQCLSDDSIRILNHMGVKGVE